MASVTNSDIRVVRTPVQVVNFKPSGRATKPLNNSPPTALNHDEPIISLLASGSIYDFDHQCKHSLLLSSTETSRNPFFHQGCVYVADLDELYTTSNLLQATSSGNLPVVLMSRVKLQRRSSSDCMDEDGNSANDVTSVVWQKLRPPQNMAMPAGGTARSDGMVFCSQGSLTEGTGGLYYMPRGKPPLALVTSFYGRDFNSPHDVVPVLDGALWFTDPCHGFEKEFRRKPVLPCHVYRFHPISGDLRVVANDLSRPTGIAFSHDETTAYITDTDAPRGDGDQDLPRIAAVYAYDVITRGNAPFLSNKRVFAVPISGVPIGIKCDDKGCVYVGCADGIEVWNSDGTLLAVIEIYGGVTNFCFGKCDEHRKELFVCAEQRLWHLQFGGDGDTTS